MTMLVLLLLLLLLVPSEALRMKQMAADAADATVVAGPFPSREIEGDDMY